MARSQWYNCGSQGAAVVDESAFRGLRYRGGGDGRDDPIILHSLPRRKLLPSQSELDRYTGLIRRAGDADTQISEELAKECVTEDVTDHIAVEPEQQQQPPVILERKKRIPILHEAYYVTGCMWQRHALPPGSRFTC
ncbi:hypothetical protein CSUI_011326 [Cystoisospora suis]|uniref:Uncharacterized protein n=1 Tax=Cystoisospora suis TaxID=483139 RepID=A0A2C6KEM9_9APIC|nr:hypothetical protein CSUI_011326 [Cystoisospora suis]